MRSVKRTLQVVLLLSAVVAVTGACSLFGGLGGETDNPMQGSAATTVGVVVENQHWSDMVVYVVSGGQRRRLGMVTTANRGSFEISQNLLTSNLYLLAEAVGSSASIRTDILNVGEGDVVVWTLENQLRLSDYVIR